MSITEKLLIVIVVMATAGIFGSKVYKQVTTVRVCKTELKAKFILECARAANPMSDEEGEDLVQQCEWTASNLYCKTVKKGSQ